jgi:hypothetical protein
LENGKVFLQYEREALRTEKVSRFQAESATTGIVNERQSRGRVQPAYPFLLQRFIHPLTAQAGKPLAALSM